MSMVVTLICTALFVPTAVSGTIVKLSAKDTITPVLLNRGDTLEFTLRNGEKRTMKLLETGASVMRTNVKDFAKEQGNGGTLCQFYCKVLIDSHEMTMQRYLPCQESFYEPYVINGMRIWFDAVQDYFDPFTLKHGNCKPMAHARFAVNDAAEPICPGLIPWYPNEHDYINVADCYVGDDVWMGAYLGGSPHGGLDINMPKGTPLYAPTDFDDQWLIVGFEPKPYYWAAYWQGVRKWSSGSIWTLRVAHINELLVEEHTPLKKGTHYAVAAGTGVGSMEHSHFVFMIQDNLAGKLDDLVEVDGNIISESENAYIIDVNGVTEQITKSYAFYVQRQSHNNELSVFIMPEKIAIEKGFDYGMPRILLDPWYLFWQMFEDDKAKRGLVHAHIAPVSPAKAGEAVSFRSDGSRPGPGKGSLSYYWTFGDGGWSNEANPTHIYPAPGIYPVSLVVDDGKGRHRFTQHITVDGEPVSDPTLSLSAPDEISFDKRKAYVTDVYGCEIPCIPHTLYYVARDTRSKPETKKVNLINTGGGDLAEASIRIAYEKEKDWVRIVHEGKANQQKLSVSVDAAKLVPGTYTAIVSLACAKALNSPQSFRISLKVRSEKPKSNVVIDDGDPEFYATPYFWVGSRFRSWVAGYKNFYLTNGGRAKEGEYFRFTPDLEAGNYRVSFVSETPFPEKSRFQVRVHHANGDTTVSMEPAVSRIIGEFSFAEGTDGFVQVFAAGSEGEVLADAIRFERID